METRELKRFSMLAFVSTETHCFTIACVLSTDTATLANADYRSVTIFFSTTGCTATHLQPQFRHYVSAISQA